MNITLNNSNNKNDSNKEVSSSSDSMNGDGGNYNCWPRTSIYYYSRIPTPFSVAELSFYTALVTCLSCAVCGLLSMSCILDGLSLLWAKAQQQHHSLVSKIRIEASNRCWYPVLIIFSSFPTSVRSLYGDNPGWVVIQE